MKMIRELEKALEENTMLLKRERRVSRQLELMIVRTEIMKSIIHQQRLMLGEINERKVA